MATFEKMGHRIRELRNQTELSIKEFAGEICVSPPTLSSYESGTRNPSIDVLKIISEKYGVSIDWLCGLSEVEYLNSKPHSYSDSIALFLKAMGHPKLHPEIKALDIYDQRYPALIFRDDHVINQFFVEWDKMKSALKSNIIDSDIYKLWEEKVSKKFNFPIADYGIAKTDAYDSQAGSHRLVEMLQDINGRGEVFYVPGGDEYFIDITEGDLYKL